MLSEDASAGIPDAVAIAAAKTRRAQAVAARKAGVDSMDIGEDYISLGREPHPESRLMREEDEGDDGDEDLADYTGSADRLYLGKEANRSAARRMRAEMGELIDDREMESGSDEETREWEDAIVARSGQRIVEARKEKLKPEGYTPTPSEYLCIVYC
jgi:GC-rich sequence DNA-binding factor